MTTKFNGKSFFCTTNDQSVIPSYLLLKSLSAWKEEDTADIYNRKKLNDKVKGVVGVGVIIMLRCRHLV